MTKELSRMSDHVIVCGFGRLGQDLASQLSHRNIPFVIVDLCNERINEATESGYSAVQGDATHDELLMELRLLEARALVVALPTDAQNVFIALTARNLVPDIQIIAKSEEESSCRKLRQAGADKIVMPHRTGAQQMERMISRPSTADFIELFTEASHLEIELDELIVPHGHPLVGCTLEDSELKDQFSLLVVGIKNDSNGFRFNPGPGETIRANDILLVLGQVSSINKLKEQLAA
ncbi:MAG: NAD-binding protein [Planctomycetota bacterium]